MGSAAIKTPFTFSAYPAGTAGRLSARRAAFFSFSSMFRSGQTTPDAWLKPPGTSALPNSPRRRWQRTFQQAYRKNPPRTERFPQAAFSARGDSFPLPLFPKKRLVRAWSTLQQASSPRYITLRNAWGCPAGNGRYIFLCRFSSTAVCTLCQSRRMMSTA